MRIEAGFPRYIPIALLLCLGSLLSLAWVAWPSLSLMYHDWMVREEYSYGLLIPVLSGYLIYQNRQVLQTRGSGRWMGVPVVFGGTLLVLVGSLGTVHALSQYGSIVVLIGLFYTLFGFRHWRCTLFPLLLLFFMVPLPHFLHQAASAQLQLLSSELGVLLVRLFGISVYLEGNIIDLGSYQLQVLEACDGLRYLFPLSTLSFIFAYLYRGKLWQRIVLFASAIPITVLMNSVRIGMIGVMVEYWGTGMAEGFLHDFQGWSIFLVCVVVLLAEAKLLARVTGDRRSLIDLLGQDIAAVDISQQQTIVRGIPAMVSASVVLLVGGLTHAWVDDMHDARPPPRDDFLSFPMGLQGGWLGQRRVLQAGYLDELQLNDYLLADFQKGSDQWANLYVAYYEDQASGRSVHSPRTCLPGGGWEMQEFQTVLIEDASGRSQPINRVVIGRGLQKQLVYYWFEQRGRSLANEYAVKWYLLRDALFEGRSDGALVRLITPIAPGQDIAGSERALDEMYRNVKSHINRYVPS